MLTRSAGFGLSSKAGTAATQFFAAVGRTPRRPCHGLVSMMRERPVSKALQNNTKKPCLECMSEGARPTQ